MSYAPANHLDHAADLVGQFGSKNVIGFMDIHRCVSVSMSVSTTESENVEHMNKIGSDVLCNRVFFQKNKILRWRM